MTYSTPPKPTPRRKRRFWPGIFAAAALGLLAVAVIAVAAGRGAAPKYSAHVQDQLVMNPADLAVTVRVANTGTAAGTPACTVQASDPSGSYSGTDAGTLSSAIQPGKFAVYVDNVTITGRGARYVTRVSVSCT
jgi:hypothetical protein